MARVAARYQIVSPFHGYVDPFAASTPSPTPPPPPAQQALLRGGGLYKLEVTSNDPDALVLAIEFALPPIASMTWDLPSTPWNNFASRTILHNWQIAAVGLFASGGPTGVTFTTVDNADLTGGGDPGRIDMNCDPDDFTHTFDSTTSAMRRSSPSPLTTACTRASSASTAATATPRSRNTPPRACRPPRPA